MRSPFKSLLFFLLVFLATTVPLCNTKKVHAQLPPAPTDLGVFTTPRLLTVTKGGTGTGTVTGVGVNCGTNCFQNYENGTNTVLTASPASGSSFIGWTGGGCSGTGTCTVSMSSAQTVTATFNVTTTINLWVDDTSRGGTGSPNTCTNSASPCHLLRARQIATCGQTIGLKDGVYTGANNMFDTFTSVLPSNGAPANPNCSLGNEITVRAVNDGAVTLDAGGVRSALRIHAMSYWKFVGFNATNNADSQSWQNLIDGGSSHITLQRIIISNVNFVPPYTTDSGNDRWNNHTFAIIDSGNNLLEDVAVFGTGRETLNERDPGSTNNIFRRVWLRWEGWYKHPTLPGECGGQPLQNGYSAHQTSTYENIITIYSAERIPATGLDCYNGTTKTVGETAPASYSSTLTRDRPFLGDHGNTYRGFIAYNYDIGVHHQAFIQGNGDDLGGEKAIDVKDFFIDQRATSASSTGPISFNCGTCTNEVVDRVTSIRMSGAPGSLYNGGPISGAGTNINEGTSLGSLPNFYTGDTPGTGARNCFEYTNGTLTSTPLWPWRMDDRIKAALAYENSAGRGGTILSGSAGTGYAANTVTSEIVSRYGAIPSACLR